MLTKILLPLSWRSEVHHLIRKVHDLATGQASFIVKRSKMRLEMGIHFYERLSQQQSIRHTEHWENKVYNISLASKRIENIVIFPSEIFSFWSLVGRPSQQHGFREGRSIIRGQLNTSVGGGLCQLSGMLYSVALQAGLEICERHAHSVDLYDETTRFAPLGSDAAVTYGRKDLRLRNSLTYPVCFRFSINDESLRVMLCAKECLPEYTVKHCILEIDNKVIQVETTRTDTQGKVEYVGISYYRCLQQV